MARILSICLGKTTTDVIHRDFGIFDVFRVGGPFQYPIHLDVITAELILIKFEEIDVVK